MKMFRDFGTQIYSKYSLIVAIQAGVEDTFMTYEIYKDDITTELVGKACTLLDIAPDVVLKQFGEYFFDFCKRSGYDRMLRTLGGNLFEFIENLDALHSYLALSYKEMNAPSFKVERYKDGSMHLHYYSDRRGLYHIVPGILGAVAMDFFNSEISMEIVNQVEEEHRTGKKEHVVFLVIQKSNLACNRRNHLADTRKQFETLLNKEDLETAVNKIRDRSHHATVCPVKRNHWETVRGIVKIGRGRLLRGFEPVYPESLWIDTKTFCSAFPFHIVFNKELRVKQAGVKIQRIVPGLQTMNIHVDQYFDIIHPEVTFTISSVRKFINSQFVLRTKRKMMPASWKKCPMLELRGQMSWMESLECMIYLCSPLLRSLHELEERQMHISDIAPHDVTRDLILLNQQRLAEMELSNQLERKKEELHILSKHLEEEKKKTEVLLYAMLPKHVANQLKEGKQVEAGEFKECTVLFSDVVTFTDICSQCEPIQIVIMLNSMYLGFDRLTTVHDVYKVETIGDAYMVVGGVPVPVSTHAMRVANFALGMIIAAKEVMNPVTGTPIQIRVGLHTGPVLAGVVGEKMPRYCLFGDTVNTASRMESHGVPNKIHLSPSVYQALKGDTFLIAERGEIEVKGKGKMHTYFLIKNLTATENEIMGWPVKQSDSGRESVQSLESKIQSLPSFMQQGIPSTSQEHHTTVVVKYADSHVESQSKTKAETAPWSRYVSSLDPVPSWLPSPFLERHRHSRSSFIASSSYSSRNLIEADVARMMKKFFLTQIQIEVLLAPTHSGQETFISTTPLILAISLIHPLVLEPLDLSLLGLSVSDPKMVVSLDLITSMNIPAPKLLGPDDSRNWSTAVGSELLELTLKQSEPALPFEVSALDSLASSSASGGLPLGQKKTMVWKQHAFLTLSISFSLWHSAFEVVERVFSSRIQTAPSSLDLPSVSQMSLCHEPHHSTTQGQPAQSFQLTQQGKMSHGSLPAYSAAKNDIVLSCLIQHYPVLFGQATHEQQE
ncbi:guanylate cyclase soluble subunit beta-2-like [Protopterus annectens]|uniref:guanylate cyclase soluble subunit beta-2-like n=1 Tax=Protopterus annectens TaxID=7888 RepID=UPI001CFC1BBF|nr:guanylate cyclase soluble subunit beta-2-like [Protopterus annectens]